MYTFDDLTIILCQTNYHTMTDHSLMSHDTHHVCNVYSAIVSVKPLECMVFVQIIKGYKFHDLQLKISQSKTQT